MNPPCSQLQILGTVKDHENSTSSADPETRPAVFLDDGKTKPSLTTHKHDDRGGKIFMVLWLSFAQYSSNFLVLPICFHIIFPVVIE